MLKPPIKELEKRYIILNSLSRSTKVEKKT